ncbi:MAG TPA: DUF4258 domain-containing protein [Candidatus Nanoarchaeia archaeon]|nr:DUF4258 domain-containing protein [Candidatus Nanoarchaeia archaeon]
MFLLELKIWYSKHARDQMVARGISEREVEEGIIKGAKRFQLPNKIIATYRYYEVVYKKIGERYFIITIQPRW